MPNINLNCMSTHIGKARLKNKVGLSKISMTNCYYQNKFYKWNCRQHRPDSLNQCNIHQDKLRHKSVIACLDKGNRCRLSIETIGLLSKLCMWSHSQSRKEWEFETRISQHCKLKHISLTGTKSKEEGRKTGTQNYFHQSKSCKYCHILCTCD